MRTRCPSLLLLAGLACRVGTLDEAAPLVSDSAVPGTAEPADTGPEPGGDGADGAGGTGTGGTQDTGTPPEGPQDRDEDGVTDDEDCDDLDPRTYPGAPELCDGRDNDCDGDVDEDADTARTWFADGDGDGFGDAETPAVSCTQPSGFVGNDRDCDDTAFETNPDADERCDGVDNDCDTDVDEDDAVDAVTWHLDFDGDGYGGAAYTRVACEAPEGHVADATDCDDSSADNNPAGTEVCDGADNDCNGTVDDDSLVLGDGDLCPAESCDALLTERPGLADGAYWLDPDSGGAFAAWCEMTTRSGGWTLVAKLTNQDDRNWTTAATDWTDTTPYGTTADLSTGSDARGEGWGRVDANNFLLTDDAGFGYIATNDDCLGGYAAADYFTLALASFPYTSNAYYDSCTVARSGFPTWAAEPDWGNNGPTSNNLSLSVNYLVIARTDGGADTSGVVSFYQTSYGEADVGLGSLEGGDRWGDSGQYQDIGGPTSCSNSDSQCATEYPETVYFWVR